MAYTGSQVCTAALDDIGVTTPSADDLETAFFEMNLILGQWAADKDMWFSAISPPATIAAVEDNINLPEEYIYALIRGLSITLAPKFNREINQLTAVMYKNATDIIKKNSKTKLSGRIPATCTVN